MVNFNKIEEIFASDKKNKKIFATQNKKLFSPFVVFVKRIID